MNDKFRFFTILVEVLYQATKSDTPVGLKKQNDGLYDFLFVVLHETINNFGINATCLVRHTLEAFLLARRTGGAVSACHIKARY